MKRWAAIAGLAAVVAAVVMLPARADESSSRSGPDAAAPAGWLELVGALHEHSGYSDGQPGSAPADYFASAKANGLDFLGSGEHSDNAALPVTANEGCIDPTAVVACVRTDGSSWDNTKAMATAATDDSFTGFRGFEWTSDRFGHLNVYFSEHYANAKLDGGYATMDTFWKWFTTSPALGGGADGLGTFNHPGAKQLADQDPTQNWNDFAYVPEADHRMVGLEVFNDTDEYGARYYAHALDKGWHVGAIGAEDLGHEPTDVWGATAYPKTVVLAGDRSPAAIREALLARRFYAVRTSEHRLTFSVDGAPMGARLVRPEGASLTIDATFNRADAILELVTSGGQVVGRGTGSLAATRSAREAERYYFLRARVGGEPVAYSSPIWVDAAAGAPSGEWVAGDLHVHTCYSHDGWCGPDDDNTTIDEAYTLSGSVEERFVEAAARGLDYLAITDHNDVRSAHDPGFGTHGVVGVPGYENSIRGHAQVLGVDELYDNGDGTAGAINRLAGSVRAAGGAFQANHPTDGITAPLDTACSDTSSMHWQYDFDVVPDTVEVWNISHLLQPPIPSQTSNADAIRYWECFLDRGHRVGVTGGSDSHWLSTAAVQGPGNPTTWVFAADRSARAIVRALRAGRTAISAQPPTAGGPRLALEADADRDGTYESIVGDEVPPDTPMRVRAVGGDASGFVTVRANGDTVLADQPLPPTGEVRFTGPAEAGWVRATLGVPDGEAAREEACDPLVGTGTTYCRNAIATRAMTSAIYIGREATAVAWTAPVTASGSTVPVSARLTTTAGVPIAGATVRFSTPSATGTGTTDAAGDARSVLVVPDHGAAITVDVSYAGTTRYRPAATTATVRWGRR